MTLPMIERNPAHQVALVMGWRRKTLAKRAARKPFSAGKKAVPVAVLRSSAMAMVKRARHRELPSNTPRLSKDGVILAQVKARIQRPTGARVVISRKVNKIGSMRASASF